MYGGCGGQKTAVVESSGGKGRRAQLTLGLFGLALFLSVLWLDLEEAVDARG